MAITAKITSKGQVTIPKKIREYLGSRFIEFDIQGDMVVVRPVKSVAGSLKRYANSQRIPDEKYAWERSVKDNNENR